MAPQLLFVTPARPRATLPSRPDALLRAFISSGFFGRVVVVHRCGPVECLRDRRGPARPGSFRHADALGSPELGAEPDAVERIVHPLPFGPAEQRFLGHLARRLSAEAGPTVVWVADPKSAGVIVDARILRAGVLRVFDAYDAWDLSPLVRGWLRRAAVRRGYAAAAASDLVFANTGALVERFRRAGARRVRLLPNGAPPVDRSFRSDRADPFVVYVGRIHERVDTSLLRAAAAVDRGVAVRIAGPLERVPEGWAALVRERNVEVLGPVPAHEARVLVGRALAALIPHRVDAYTRSQDSMKAWEAIAVGTPVVSTSVPPAVEWPRGLAIVADDPDAFAAGVATAISGSLEATREARLRYAEANGWPARAQLAIRAIREALDE
jgi:glycosyltransferase involved in cell wall biosynthesis